MIFVTVAAILVKLMGFTFWLLCVVLVCYARVRSEENLRALAEKKALDLQSKLTKVQMTWSSYSIAQQPLLPTRRLEW